MICEKCKKEFSPKVWRIHVKMCNIENEILEEEGILVDADTFETEELTEEEIRSKAKELGIKSWHVKSIERLIQEIQEVE